MKKKVIGCIFVCFLFVFSGLAIWFSIDYSKVKNELSACDFYIREIDELKEKLKLSGLEREEIVDKFVSNETDCLEKEAIFESYYNSFKMCFSSSLYSVDCLDGNGASCVVSSSTSLSSFNPFFTKEDLWSTNLAYQNYVAIGGLSLTEGLKDFVDADFNRVEIFYDYENMSVKYVFVLIEECKVVADYDVSFFSIYHCEKGLYAFQLQLGDYRLGFKISWG